MSRAHRTIHADREPDFIQGDGVRLACFAQGDPDQPAIVFVHGYPDTHAVWDRVIAELSGDFYCICYDVRGAGASSRPRRVSAYRLGHLEADLKAVLDWASPEAPVHLVAHDWGSIQAWEAVTDRDLEPRIASFTSISGPCLDHAGYWLREQWRTNRASLMKQARKSWYMAALHIPLLPALSWYSFLSHGWAEATTRWEGEPLPENPTLARDGAFGANLYRANVLPRLLRPRPRHTRVPVQVITPLGDPFVGPDFVHGLDQWVDQLSVRPIDGGHWAILTKPGEIADRVSQFARAPMTTQTNVSTENVSNGNVSTKIEESS